jgi:hypothetical protein
MYLNGVSVTVTEDGTPDDTRTSDASSTLYIGNNHGGNRTFDGSVAGMQIYNCELTAEDVKTLYAGGNIPYKYTGAPHAELIYYGMLFIPQFWTLGSGWSSNPNTLEADYDGTTSYAGLTQTLQTALVKGQAYRITFDVINSDITLATTLGDSSSHWLDTWTSYTTYAVGSHSVAGVATIGGTGFGMYAHTTAGSGTINNISVERIGVVAEYDGASATSSKWYDKSGNTTGNSDLDGTVSGATISYYVSPTVAGIVSTANSTAITIDSVENIGIGVSPDSGEWQGAATVVRIGDIAALWSLYDMEPFPEWYQLHLSENVRCSNDPNGEEQYLLDGPASDYQQKQGTHTFKVASSGDEDDEISWTTALEIKNDGRGLSQFTAKAWAYFDGTGTPSFHDSYNCSTITDGGTGTYSINYTNNLGSADYAAVGSVGYCQHGPLGTDMKMVVTNRAERSEDQGGDSTAALCRMIVATGRNGGPADDDNISLVVFGD